MKKSMGKKGGGKMIAAAKDENKSVPRKKGGAPVNIKGK